MQHQREREKEQMEQDARQREIAMQQKFELDKLKLKELADNQRDGTSRSNHSESGKSVMIKLM